MNVSNPRTIMQIATRRNDFLKPVEIYGIVDIFGVSMLSSEGENWKRHRKIVAPAFSEKSNTLVWKESLKQSAGMLDFWSKLPGNSAGFINVEDTAPDTALMTLHVICGAGFGVRQVWDNEGEKELGEKAIPGFNTTKLKGNHTLTFKYSLNTLLHGIIWMALFPVWLLSESSDAVPEHTIDHLLDMLPFDVPKKIVRSYFECADYFKELSEYKVEQLERGEEASQGTMDLMGKRFLKPVKAAFLTALGPLIKASENKPDDSSGQYMTKQDVIANSWIFLFAGHETTANTLHFAFLFLAISLGTQASLQQHVDATVGSRPSEDWKYDVDMGRLYSSMVGAVINETLRLMPPIIDIPKIVKGNSQHLEIEGESFTVAANTFIHINAVGVHRSPRYWPHSPSKTSSKTHDLDDFVPDRWLLPSQTSPDKFESKASSDSESADGFEKRPSSPASQLFTPTKGSFIPFSEGARACPGRRFAQVEMTAVLAVIFQTHTVELSVREWASDEDVDRMGNEERRAVYEKAKAKARRLIRESETIITLQMLGASVPVSFVKRGDERFMRCYI